MIGGETVNDFREPACGTRQGKFFGIQLCAFGGGRCHDGGIRVTQAAVRIRAGGEPAGALVFQVAKRASHITRSVWLMECMCRMAFLARFIHPARAARFGC